MNKKLKFFLVLFSLSISFSNLYSFGNLVITEPERLYEREEDIKAAFFWGEYLAGVSAGISYQSDFNLKKPNIDLELTIESGFLVFPQIKAKLFLAANFHYQHAEINVNQGKILKDTLRIPFEIKGRWFLNEDFCLSITAGVDFSYWVKSRFHYDPSNEDYAYSVNRFHTGLVFGLGVETKITEKDFLSLEIRSIQEISQETKDMPAYYGNYGYEDIVIPGKKEQLYQILLGWKRRISFDNE